MQDLMLHTESMDLLTANGDLVIGQSDRQHQALLLMLEKGSLKEFPVAGVGAFRYLESEAVEEFLREIRLQFSGDGMQVNAISIKEGKLNIEAPYK